MTWVVGALASAAGLVTVVSAWLRRRDLAHVVSAWPSRYFGEVPGGRDVTVAEAQERWHRMRRHGERCDQLRGIRGRRRR